LLDRAPPDRCRHRFSSTVVEQLLKEDIGVSLDSTMFSNSGGTAAAPPGLMAGIAPLTATAGGGANALQGDLALLGGAVGQATGNADGIVFVASPAYAIRAGLYKTVVTDTTNIWPSIGVANGVLVAVQSQTFVSAFDALPKILVSTFTAALVICAASLSCGQVRSTIFSAPGNCPSE
jgi:hypothetical protein